MLGSFTGARCAADQPRPRLAVATSAAWLGLSAALLLAAPATGQQALPAPLVYLRSIDASIIQDMRYATEHNFTGRRVPGYDAAECILHRQAAIALSKVQSALRERGMSLKVYDCYRPQRAVVAFVAWANDRYRTRAPRGFIRGWRSGSCCRKAISRRNQIMRARWWSTPRSCDCRRRRPSPSIQRAPTAIARRRRISARPTGEHGFRHRFRLLRRAQPYRQRAGVLGAVASPQDVRGQHRRIWICQLSARVVAFHIHARVGGTELRLPHPEPGDGNAKVTPRAGALPGPWWAVRGSNPRHLGVNEALYR